MHKKCFEDKHVVWVYFEQNGVKFDQPLGVADEADLQRVLQHMGEVDWLEYATQQRPNSKWQITLLTNIAFHVYPLVDRPLRGVERKANCPSG